MPTRSRACSHASQDNTISGKIAKEVFDAMWSEGKGADEIIEAKGLRQITDTSAIESAIDDVLAKNPGQLADYRSGKDKLFGFFVGQVMKATGARPTRRSSTTCSSASSLADRRRNALPTIP